MKLTVVSDDGKVLRLKATGRIAQNVLAPHTDALGELLGEQRYARRVSLDMADVAFLDSSGIGWLLVRHKWFREAGGKLVVHSLPPVVLDVLKVLRLDYVFCLAEDETTALAIAAREDQ